MIKKKTQPSFCCDKKTSLEGKNQGQALSTGDCGAARILSLLSSKKKKDLDK